MEGARADRDRMKTLLVEAIATLCRNGLQYDEELCVEGLIGITLDKRDVFLVSVKETFSSSVASNANVTKNGRDTPQSVDSPQTVSKKAHKRSGASTNEGPPEKNKRKGNAPKQIPVEEIELLNNSPSAHDVSLEDNNSDTVQSDPLHAGATIAGTGTYEPYDQNSRSSIGDSEAIVIEDPDLPSIKKEIVKQENQNSCMYTPSAKRSPMTKPAYSDSSQKHSRPMPPLHPRPDQPSPGSADPNDPRSKHPAGVDPEQFAIFAQEIKTEQDSDPDLSVFTSPSGEIIRVPRSMNSMNQDQAIPVSMVSSGTLSGATASTSGTLPMEGMADFSGVPVDWGSPSTSQEFITMPGDDSTQESPSQQAPGSSGASQQKYPAEMKPAAIEPMEGTLVSDSQIDESLEVSVLPSPDKGVVDNTDLTELVPAGFQSNDPNDQVNQGALVRKPGKKSRLTDPLFTCVDCTYTTRRKYNLERHMVTHGGDKKFKCESCDKQFADSYSLKIHVNVAHNRSCFMCEICSSTFKTPSGLANHKRSVHDGKHRYVCDTCNKGYQSKDHYLAHCSRHMGIKLFECTKCHKQFRAKSYFKEHIVACQGEKQFVCEDCGISFAYPKYLAEHKAGKHSKSSMYTCVCGKTYNWRASFHRHKCTCQNAVNETG